MFVFFARMFYSYVWYAQFKVVPGPVSQFGFLLGSFFGHVEVCKQYQRCITSYEYKDVPYTVHVREVYGEPRVTEHSVNDPGEYREAAHRDAA